MQNGNHNNPEQPIISVVIPAYNVSTYIGEALDSVFVQDFKSYEVIVVNDGSTDTTELEKILEPYGNRIRYIYQENRGISAARNAALRVARGELIALLDADDSWQTGKLTEQLAFMKEGNFDMVYGDALLIGDVPWPTRTTFMDRSPSNGPVTLENLLNLRVTVVVSTVIVRRDLLEQCGSFDEADRNLTEDFDLWLRLAHKGARIGYQRKILANYRYRSDSISANRMKLHEAALRVLQKTRLGLVLNDSEKEALDLTAQKLESILILERAKIMIIKGQVAEARAVMAKVRKTSNSWKVSVSLVLLHTFPGLLSWYLQKRNHS